ncbi:uncharacterized protein LOC107401232 [Peromyscus maniculatus bairdii]|uniref:uncharacterized protein LOC107401232 n=1 Tax=Peromyscus maniculatus bairdii TaxID=230844 RepID=UPI003FD25CB8
MVGVRPDAWSHAPFFLFLSPEGRQVGGRAEAHLGPSSRGFARSRTRAHKGRRARKARRDQGPPGLTAAAAPRHPPTPATRARSSLGARRPPRSPAPGHRPTVRAQHPGKVGRGGGGRRSEVRAQPPAGGGGRAPPPPPPSCLPRLTCVLGGVLTAPLPPRRGEGPLWVAAFPASNSPQGRRESHPRARAAPSHAAEGRSVGWGKSRAATPGDPAAAAAAAPEASPKWPPPSRPPPPLPPPPPPRLVIATAGAARPLAIHNPANLKLKSKRCSCLSLGPTVSHIKNPFERLRR